jgi:hypothetical protein
MAKLHFIQEKLHIPEVATKEWGEEHIICRHPHACKVMILKPGYQVSLHWHRKKSETFVLIKGQLIIEMITREGKTYTHHLTEAYSSVTLLPNTPHTFYCPDGQLKPTIFMEASTRDSPDDSYRVYPSGPRPAPDYR